MEENNKTESIRYPEIAAEIEAMVKVDQDMREGAIDDEETWDESVDPKNTFRMKEIIEQVGWPTISKVGKAASSGAWLLVQHADKDLDFQKLCLNLMKQEPLGEVDLHDIAYLEDRVRVNSGQPQLYGTQFQQVEGRFVSREIEDQDQVNKRRKEMGLVTLEENIEDMYVRYRIEKSGNK